MSDDPPPWYYWPVCALAGAIFDAAALVAIWYLQRAARRPGRSTAQL